ncbi:unnamed protein product, partial [Cyprideis torosa]
MPHLLPESLLVELGFDPSDEAQIPLANEENKALQTQIQALRSQLAEERAAVAAERNRRNDIERYLKESLQDSQRIQRLIELKRVELESEHSQANRVQWEIDGLKQEIGRLEKEDARLHKKCAEYEQKIAKYNQKIGSIRRELRWDQAMSEEWIRSMTESDEAATVLIKYAEVDAGKIKDLTLQLEKYGDLLKDLRERHEDAVLKKKMAASMLHAKMAQATALKKEAAELGRCWGESLDTLRRGDAAIAEKDKEINIYSELCESLLEEKRKQERYLQREVHANEDARLRIESLRKSNEQRREDLEKRRRRKADLEDEICVHRNTIKRLEDEISASVDERTKLSHQSEDLQRRIERLIGEQKDLEEKLKELSDAATSSERRAQLATELVEDSEEFNHEMMAKLESLLRQKQALTATLSESSSRLEDLMTKAKGKRAEIQSLEATQKQLEEAIDLKEAEADRVDFRLSGLERRRLLLVGAEKEAEVGEAEFVEERKRLLQEIERKQRNCLQIQQERDLVEERNKRSVVALSKQEEAIAKSENSLQEFLIERQRHERVMKSCKDRLSDLCLERLHLHSNVKLVRGRLEDAMDERRTEEETLELVGLEYEREKAELESRLDLALVRVRLSDEEKRKLAGILNSVEDRAGKLKKNYEILMSTAGVPREDGSEVSAAYLIIHNAQVKEEMRAKLEQSQEVANATTDNLNACLNSIQVFEDRNRKFRQIYVRAPEDVDRSSQVLQRSTFEEGERKAKLEAKIRLNQLQDEVEHVATRLSQLEQERERLQNLKQDRKESVKEQSRELADLDRRLGLAEKSSTHALKEIRKKAKQEDQETGGSELENAENTLLDIQIRDLKLRNNLLLNRLGSICVRKPEIREAAEKLFEEMSLPISLLTASMSNVETTPFVSPAASQSSTTSHSSARESGASQSSATGGSGISLRS